MVDFLTKYFNYITYVFEFFALIVAVFCFKKFKHTATRVFIFYIAYVMFVELVGISFFYFKSFPITKYLISLNFYSTAWYNLAWLFGSVIFVLYYIQKVLENKKNKWIVRVLNVMFLVIMLSHFLLYPNVFLKEHHPLYQFLGAFSILIACSIYFLEFVNSNKLLNAFSTFSFYALSALLIWWLIITPILFFNIYNTEADWDFANLKRRIFVFANIFMYSCFAIGLIVSKPKLNK